MRSLHAFAGGFFEGEEDDEGPPALGIVSFCPTRIMAPEPRPFALMIAFTVVLCAWASDQTVSPGRTVWVEPALELGFDDPGEGVLLELLEELPDPGIVSTWPTRMRLGLESLFAEASFALVVPYRAAIAERVCPLVTV